VKGGAFIDFSIGPHSSAVPSNNSLDDGQSTPVPSNPSSSAVSERPEQFVTILAYRNQCRCLSRNSVSPCFADRAAYLDRAVVARLVNLIAFENRFTSTWRIMLRLHERALSAAGRIAPRARDE